MNIGLLKVNEGQMDTENLRIEWLRN